MLAQEDQSGQGADRRIAAEQHPEGALGDAAQGHHVQRIGQGAGDQGDDQAQRQDGRRQQAQSGRGRAEGDDRQRRRRHAHRHRRAAGQVTDPLAEDDVERPANGGGRGIGAAQRVEGLAGSIQRQQQDQAQGGDADPDEVDQASGVEQGHGQGAGEFDGQGHAQGDGVQRHVEAEVHEAHDHAIDGKGLEVGPREPRPPRPPHGDQHQGRQPHAQGRRPRRSDHGIQGLGEGRPRRQGDDRPQQGEVGQGGRQARRARGKRRGGHGPWP
ncbi:hypothetical protein D3C80_1205860 [compost metagenome]